jgi:hypothetical protein
MAVRLATKNGLARQSAENVNIGVRMGGGGWEGLGAGALEVETDRSIIPELVGKWTLVTLVVDESRIRLYYNATLKVAAPIPPGEFVPSSPGAAPELLIGWETCHCWFRVNPSDGSAFGSDLGEAPAWSNAIYFRVQSPSPAQVVALLPSGRHR